MIVTHSIQIHTQEVTRIAMMFKITLKIILNWRYHDWDKKESRHVGLCLDFKSSCYSARYGASDASRSN